MNRKHIVVHAISLVAIVIGLFSPILTLPVLAEDPLPEPDITLTTDNDSTQEITDANPEEGPNPESLEGDGETGETPVLVAVIPVLPVLSDVACVDGTVHAQAPVAAVTDGITYEISAPDASGVYVVKATLTDASVYTWADGLTGWDVNSSVATASGSVALCTLPDTEVPTEPDDPSADGEDDSDENIDPGEDESEDTGADGESGSDGKTEDDSGSDSDGDSGEDGDADDSIDTKDVTEEAGDSETKIEEAPINLGAGDEDEGSDDETSDAGLADDSVIVPMDTDLAYYTLDVGVQLGGPIQPGATITYVVTVSLAETDVGFYRLYAQLPENVTYIDFDFLRDDLDVNASCSLQGQLLGCEIGTGKKISIVPHIWEISVTVDSDYVNANTCANGLTATFFGFWEQFPGPEQVVYPLTLDSALCTQTLEMTHSVWDVPAGTSPATVITAPGVYEYRYDISSTGAMPVSDFSFIPELPVGVTLDQAGSILPTGCSFAAPDNSQINCTGPLNPGSTITASLSGTVPENAAGMAADVCINGTVSSATLVGTSWDGGTHTLTANVPLESSHCTTSLSMEFDADIADVTRSDEQVSFTATIFNSSAFDAPGANLNIPIPDSLQIGTWTVTQSGDTGSCAVVDNEVDCDDLTVPGDVGDGSGILTVTMSLPADLDYPAEACTSHTVTATLAPAQTDDASVSITCDGRFEMEITADSLTIEPGDDVIYTITLTNVGNGEYVDPSIAGTHLYQLKIHPDLPPMLLVDSSGDLQCAPVDGGENCYIYTDDPIASGSSRFNDLKLSLPQNDLPPTVCESGIQPVLNEAYFPVVNQPEFPIVRVDCGDNVGLEIAKSGPTEVQSVGVGFEYEITVTNTATETYSDPFSFTDTLPAGVVVDPNDLPTGCELGPDDGATTVTCAYNEVETDIELVPGSDHIVKIPVVVTQESAVEICAGIVDPTVVQLSNTVTGDVGGWNPFQQTASVNTGFNCSPSLSLSISPAVASVAGDGTYEITATVTNNGSASEDFYAFQAMWFTLNMVKSDFTIPDSADCFFVLTVPVGNLHCYYASNAQLLGPGESHAYTFKAGLSELFACGSDQIEAQGLVASGAWESLAISTHYVDFNCQDLSIEKSVNATSAPVDQPFTYTVTVTNSGDNAFGTYAFTDELPPGIQLTGETPITAPDGAACTPNVENGITTIDCESTSGPEIPEGENSGSHTYTFNVRSNYVLYPEICTNTSVTNTVTGTTGIWTDSQDDATITIECAPKLTLGIIADRTEAEPGDTIQYIVSVTNVGHKTEDRYLFWNALPADTRLADPDYTMPTGAHCHQNTTGSQYFDCEGYNLAPGATHVYIFRAKVSTTASPTMCQGLTNWLRAPSIVDNPTGVYGQWDPAVMMPNSVPNSVTLLCPALSIQKTDSVEESIGFSQPFDYTITVTNSGDTDKGDFTVIDYLPAGIVLVGDLDPRCELGTSGTQTTVTCEDSEVSRTMGNTFTLSVMASELAIAETCGDVENKVSGDKGIWVPGKQTAFVTTTITCVPGFDFSVEPVAASVVPGESIGFIVTIHNSGDLTATGYTLLYYLSAHLPDGATWQTSYEINGSPIDLNAGFIPLAPGDTMTVVFDSGTIPTDIPLATSEWCISWEFSSSFTSYYSIGSEQHYDDNATVQVNCSVIALESEVSPQPVAPGEQLTITITATNIGNTDLTLLFLFADINDAIESFSDWTIVSDASTECEVGYVDDRVHAGCLFAAIERQEVVTITITATAPQVPAWEQCGPAEITPWHLFFVAGAPIILEPWYGEPLTVSIDCQPRLAVNPSGVVETGDDDRVDAGDVFTYTVELRNSGNVNFYDIVVTSMMDGIDWHDDLIIDFLAPGESTTVTGTYVITQEDIDAGVLVSPVTVQASLVPPVADDADASRFTMVGFTQVTEPLPDVQDSISISLITETKLAQEPGVELLKSSDANGDLSLEDTVTYTFTVTNTGNVTLTGLELVDERDDVAFADGSGVDTLAPGESAELTATYVVNQNDVDAGEIENCADVTASAPDERTVSADDCVTDSVAPNPTPEPTATTTVPATPEPTVPATPAPTDPPATPIDPATPDTEPDPTAAVTGLPQTGSGGIGTVTPILWIAAVFGFAIMTVGGLGIRERT